MKIPRNVTWIWGLEGAHSEHSIAENFPSKPEIPLKFHSVSLHFSSKFPTRIVHVEWRELVHEVNRTRRWSFRRNFRQAHGLAPSPEKRRQPRHADAGFFSAVRCSLSMRHDERAELKRVVFWPVSVGFDGGALLQLCQHHDDRHVFFPNLSGS